MSYQVIDGKAISVQIKEECREKVTAYKEKGIEVDIDYDYGSLNVSYYDGIFHFETYVILNFYEIYDEE